MCSETHNMASNCNSFGLKLQQKWIYFIPAWIGWEVGIAVAFHDMYFGVW